MTRKVKIISILSLLVVCLYAGWEFIIIGQTSHRYYSYSIGEGRNDGIKRLYCGTSSAEVLELSFEDGEWEMKSCGKANNLSFCNISTVTVGDGRGDGVNRIYAAVQDGYVYEYSYENEQWKVEKVGGASNWVTGGADVGIPRNDGVMRVVGAGYTSTREFTWNGNDWDELIICPGNIDFWAVNIDDGRGDGLNRIYSSDGHQSNNCIREYSWNGTEYTEMQLNAPNQMIKTAIGPARNDGKNRVYGAGRFGHVYEFTWENDQWNMIDIQDETSPLLSRYGLEVGMEDDGKYYVYSTAQSGDTRRHSYLNNQWEEEIVESVTGATVNIGFGDARNDGKQRLYIAAIGKTYECFPPEVYIGEQAIPKGIDLKNYPNPFNPETQISFEIYENSDVSMMIYNSKGQIIDKLYNGMLNSGYHEFTFDGSNLVSGVYYCKIYIGKVEYTRAMNLVK
ncbi:MAG: T9SS type A sorting domain-containing protein [Candidatus Delongbacteria bacterium]|nr:T9SS type A sorting domain-containing protein [Candidatus Delongbacteria bacterium]MBN2835963.1 T9SS type A sorting domain-containing protein [Candidatus Delongbacteria bacterium]